MAVSKIDTNAITDDAVNTAKINSDFYETGSWTPTLDFSSTSPSTITYARQAGSYVKIGGWVWCHFQLALSALSGESGSAQLYGLPYTISNVQNGRNNRPQGHIAYSALFNSRGPMAINFIGGTNYGNLFTIDTTNNEHDIASTDSHFNGNEDFRGSFFYEIA